ncbi:MAG: hypothetical protein KDA41_02550 [Planctomycetales bacterium]|nr:hypothetical protein [Planctomycetales bacterium]
MATTPNRAAILTKAHKVLKKHYTPVKPSTDRPVLETLLYACCLENAPYNKADDTFAKLQEMYYGWNEVRVAAATEIAEIMEGLPNPRSAAHNLKRCLQNIFETHYSFDIESLRKQNLGKAGKQLEKYGLSQFAVGYATQSVLGGHAIPVDDAALQTLHTLGVITDEEFAKKSAPGLERAIAKSKGVEFGSLLHQLSIEFLASPFGAKPRKILTEIEPSAKDRMPKRASAKPAAKQKKAAEAGDRKKPAKKPAKKAAESGKTAEPRGKKSATKRLARKKPR